MEQYAKIYVPDTKLIPKKTKIISVRYIRNHKPLDSYVLDTEPILEDINSTN